MNLSDFEKYIDKKILDRGYDYYSEGNIIETYEQGDNVYIFDVEGSDDYQVVVKIDGNGEILYSECDCPYDFGPICKHEVAAFFELLDIFNKDDKKEKIEKEIIIQPEIKDVLNNLSKEELINIISDLVNKDVALKNSIIFKYSKGNDEQELQKCKRAIDSIVRKHTGRGGFINYGETWEFVSELGDVLDKVRDTSNILLALDIAFMVLEEAIGAFEYSDDSDGEVGDLIEETLGLMNEIVIESKALEIATREKVFNKLLGFIGNTVFHGWEEYRNDILRICTEFADEEVFRNKLKMVIEHEIDVSSKDGYKKYINESLLKILFGIIQDYGTKEEAEQFIKVNLTFSPFRELFIDKYIEEKNYNKVLELALEGEKQDEQYAGLVLKWKKIRYEAFKELSFKEEQEKLAKELFLDGSFEYYSELKELFKGDKQEFYNSLKQELKNYKGWHGRNIYLRLIKEESDLDEILEYVKENPKEIEEYENMLLDKFKDEVIEIYTKHIKLEASSASNRKEYQRVCGVLKRYKKVAGKEKQKFMVNELSALYRKRPAFLDELCKIK